ncbi:uncharacterized protein AMSG_02352 [Thecamonas trahens ATCC 50062]|uniref:Transmembrane protein n=1 Tax=Thecamonas trahens ATCC 50062 TaxID=461836 RepID=A0A0L0DW33_THETB|nr:hypothetical protein AMSG_02352 [Thecamonas trahens ATCC 50062]KNC56382.1 hypothetical protein AMSG_02352 [Thecamonas trahens ATCC 50062]|eukprot:XP_013760897.1 hypothetical protein AMSG_02352 [Thecamonas trahens ATCC 50062]
MRPDALPTVPAPSSSSWSSASYTGSGSAELEDVVPRVARSAQAGAGENKPQPPEYVEPQRDRFGRLVGGRYAPKHTRRKSRTIGTAAAAGRASAGAIGAAAGGDGGAGGVDEPQAKRNKRVRRSKGGRSTAASRAAVAEPAEAEQVPAVTRRMAEPKAKLDCGDWIRIGVATTVFVFNLVVFITCSAILYVNYDDPCDKKINIGLALLATWFGMLTCTSLGLFYARIRAVMTKTSLPPSSSSPGEARMTAKVYHTACMLSTAVVAASMVLVAGISSIFVFTSSEAKCDTGLYNAGYYYTLIAFGESGAWMLAMGCLFCFHYLDTM